MPVCPVACLPLWAQPSSRLLESGRVFVCARVWGLTQCPQLHGDVHIAVLSAIVHGLLQGFRAGPAQPHGPLAAAALAGGVALLHALGQDLLQGQDVSFGLLGLCQELPQDVPAGPGMMEGECLRSSPWTVLTRVALLSPVASMGWCGPPVGTRGSQPSPPRQAGPGLPAPSICSHLSKAGGVFGGTGPGKTHLCPCHRHPGTT